MSSKKIVIISRTILPTIAPRAYRATELAKALAKKGHDVTLIASLGKYNYDNFEKKTGITVKDLGTPSFSLRNSDGKLKLPLWKKGFVFLLMKILEFPDILLMRKVKKAVLNEGKFDLLITIAIPHQIHWGASLIKKNERSFACWTSDCGDPFMGNSFNKPFFYFKYFEKRWGKKTDFITVPVEGARDAYYNEVQHKIRVIPQGFDFSSIQLSEYKKNKIPVFLYAGLFYPERRDPTRFFEYLCTLPYDFKFIIYATKADLIEPFLMKLGNKIEIRTRIERNQLIEEMSKVDFLINITNMGTTTQVPSKLIDYSLSKRPILELTSSFDKDEQENFDDFVLGKYKNQKVVENLEQYNSINVAESFLQLIGK